MMIHTKSATPLVPVMLEASSTGRVHVWLRKNITHTVEEFDGSEVDVYEADEVYFVADDITVEYVESNFNALWAKHENDGLTDRELILGRISEMQDALAELGDLIAEVA